MTSCGWLEREYATVAAVPDYPAIEASWAERMVRALAQHPPTVVPYGEGERREIDLYRPAGADDPPVLVWIHGGYWQRRHRREFAWIATPWLARGVAVALPGYPLCPEVTLSALVEDVRSAVALLWREAGALGLSRRWLVGGHSAGGHLAAIVAATDWGSRGLADLSFRAVLPSSGLFDLAPLLGTTHNRALGLDLAEATRLSPLLHVPPRGTRLLAAVGGAESREFRRQSHDFAVAWQERGAAAASLELPGRHHFTAQDAWAEPESALFAAAWAFLTCD
ncbi:MAG: alpha/beta hydrolase [Elioraea sp.]|nr:alpha/beta hydrolase [Elioraea sp.]